MTSGACGPLLPLLALIASISSLEPPSGFSSLILMPYFAVKPSMHLAVVAPVLRQGDRGQVAFGLGGVDQGLGHAGDRVRPAPALAAAAPVLQAPRTEAVPRADGRRRSRSRTRS